MVARGDRLVLYLFVTGIVALVTSIVVPQAEVFAAFTASMEDGANSAKGVDQATTLFGPSGTFQTITNVLLFVVGAVSVIMLIVGGIRYVVSGGDSTAVQGAKNTILYAIVGIVICLLAYAVVSFVISSFTGSGTPAGGTGTNV